MVELEKLEFDKKSKANQILATLGRGTNWKSPKQVQDKLYGEWELPIRQINGKNSTAKNALKALSYDPRVQTLLELKDLEGSLRQLCGIKPFIDPTTNRIHPYNDTLGADTGRTTSSKPNLQNIKKTPEFRNCFRARPGHKLIVIDFSQIEPRVLAHFVGDGAFRKLFEHGDFYTELGKLFAMGDGSAPSRDIAKMVILAAFYGMGPKTLAESLKITPHSAEHILQKFSESFPEIEKFRDLKHQEARRYGFATGLMNRRRWFPELNSEDLRLRYKSERQILNAVIQGSATTLFKFKLAKLRKLLPQNVRFLMHVHDEVVLEAPEQDAQELFETAVKILEEPEPWFDVPIKVAGGVGSSWANAKNQK